MNGISLNPRQQGLLLKQVDYVLEKNADVRLTAIPSVDAALRLHVIDSLLALPELTASPPGPLLDIGSGGGYPGIPLAIATDRKTDLLDSVQKKMRIIQEFLDREPELVRLIRTIALRAEELALDSPNHYAVTTARALSSLPAVLELSAPLLQEKGRVIALKGDLDPEERERGNKAAELLGLRHVSTREYTLKPGNEKRVIVVFEKRGAPNLELPRRPGRAQKKPLV
jgi:16S rRNA (guanine527-N7)-methyltransferase